MLASKPKAHASASSAPRVSRLAKPAAAETRAPSPLHNAARSTPLDVLPKSSPGDRRSFKASPHRTTTSTPDRRQPRIAKASELQAQLNLVQEDLKNAREHLVSIDRDRAQVHDDLALTKKLADEAYQKLEESLAAQRRAEEALELEKFKSFEREQASIELAKRKEEEWQQKHGDVTKRHAQDVAKVAKELGNAKGELAVMAQARNSAISRADDAEKIADASAKKAKILMAEVTKELENAKGELAVTVQAKNLAVSRADKTEKIAEASAKKAEILMAEVTRLKSEMENRAEEAAEIIGKLRSEASELRAELQRAMAFQEKLARAEEVVEGLKADIAYSKRAEMDAVQLAQGWKTKAESMEASLVEITSLNKSNEDSLASLTKNLEDTRSQLVQLKEKAASSESEASEYKEGFLETNRRLDAARKEASELQAAIDRLRSEHELLSEAHRQVVSKEKAASAQVKGRLVQELDDTREERDKAKKAVEDLAAARRQVSSEAREAKERVLVKQTELDHAQLQISELKAALKNADDKYQLMFDESNNLRKTVERLRSEAKTSQDEWVSKEAGFAEMLKISEEGTSSIRSELMESLRVAEREVQELKAERTQLIHELEGLDRNTMDASPSAEKPMAESSHLKDLLSSKEKEVLALNHQVTDLRLRETATLAKADELSKLLIEATARKAEEEEAAKSTEKSNALLIKLEMDKVLDSLKAAECEAKAAKDDRAQLQSKLRLVESKITEANLTTEEEKISSLRLKETLAEKEEELLSIAQENEGLRAREAAARAKADELASLLVEAAAMKGEYQSNGVAARSPEKQPNVFLKMMCSPMDNVVRGDHEARKNSDRIVQVEEIKHVEVETVRQVKLEREVSVSAVEANSLENSKIIEDDLSKEIRSNGIDTESSDGDDIESQGDDGVVDQMDGLLIHGPTSSFKQEQHSNKKKKKALLRKFGSMLKKKAHFTKLSNHT